MTAAALASAFWVAASPLAGASTVTTQYVVNGGFENATHGWRTNSAVEHLTITDHSRNGHGAAVLTTSAVASAALNDAVNSVAHTVAGRQYIAKAWVRTSTGKVSGQLRLREVAGGKLVTSAGTSFFLTDNVWREVTLSYTAARDGSTLDLNVLGWNLGLTQSLVIDDVSLSSVEDSASTTTPPPAPTTTAPAPAPTTTKPAPAPTTTAPAPAPTTTKPAPAPTTTAPAPAPTTTKPAPAPTTTAPAPAPTTTAPAPAPTTTAPAPAPTTTSAPSCSVSAILVPSCGAWWGVAASVLGSESIDQALVNYESTIGRTVGIAHYYHRGTQLFPTATEIARATQPGARRLLLENWKPENGSSWAGVAAGDQDPEIDAEAAYLKAHFTARFFLSVHHEPDDEVVETAGSGFEASDYRAMFRHVVLRLRADGVDNIVSVMDYTGSARWGSASWYSQMYPGNDVVDWLAEDPYVVGPVGGAYDSNFDQMVNRQLPGYSFPGFYSWANQVAGDKPIMLAEWGVDDMASVPSFKADKFDYMAAHLGDMPRVKALVYWNSNTFPNAGTTRVDSSAGSLAAFRRLGALPALNPPVPSS